jgi:hypothetical protein
LSVKKAARAKNTNAIGDERPLAELLGAVVVDAAPVEDEVCDPVDEPEEVFEAEDLELVVDAEVEEPVEVVDEPEEVEVEEPVDEEPVEDPEDVEDAADAELDAPPISWNCVL